MNSGALKISVSSWLHDLSIYFKCVLVLTKCLTLLRSCCRVGYGLYVGSNCSSLKLAWRTTVSNGSDNRACLSSIVYGLF